MFKRLMVLVLALAVTNVVWGAQHPDALQYGTDIVSTSAGYSGEGSTAAAFNGAGLDGGGLLHDVWYQNKWSGNMDGVNGNSVSPRPGCTAGVNWLEVEFNGVKKLINLWGWNYNDAWDFWTQRGMKEVVIEYSTTGGTASSEWTRLGGAGATYEFARAPGAENYAHNTEIDFEGIVAKYVVFTPLSIWGSPPEEYQFVGVAELSFFSTPLAEAADPEPGDDDLVLALNKVLSWREGGFVGDVNGHDVYFGTIEAAVTDANVSNPMGVYQGRQSQTSFDPCGLEVGITYYWRIDEVNETDPNLWPGEVWSFATVEVLGSVAIQTSSIVDASSGYNFAGTDPWDTINGQGLTGDLHGNSYVGTMWLGANYLANTQYNGGTAVGKNYLAYEFDQVYDLDKMWVWNLNSAGGTDQGMKNVTVQYSTIGGGSASEWTTLGGGTVQFNIATGLADYAHNTEIDFNSVKAKYVVLTVAGGAGDGWWGPGGIWVGLSELRFHFSAYLGKATVPKPIEGFIGIRANMYLSWTPNEFATSHDVYVGTDLNDVDSAARLLGDADGDGSADNNDVAVIAAWWLTDANGSQPYADLNHDGIVNFEDLRIVANGYGNSGDPQFKGNQSQTSYSTAALDYNSTYYWRVDERRKASRAKGRVWSFSTAPTAAWNLAPTEGGTTARILGWEPGFYTGDVNGHDVYLGTSYNDVNNATTASAEYVDRISMNYYDIASYDDFNGLTPGQTYYWRVDEVNDSVGVPFKGDVRSFLHTKRRIIFNCDGAGVLGHAGVWNDGVSIRSGDPQVKFYKWVSAIFDPLEGSRVDTVSWCDGSGGNTALYGSDVIEPWGFRIGGLEPTVMGWIADGRDPAVVVPREAHKRGLEAWYSFRINDIHDGFYQEEYPTFKQDNPGWMIGTGWPYGHPTALRFDVCDVRDIKFDTIVEMFIKYDFDGIEIDWMRSPTCFYPGTEPANAHYLTTFMARVRTRLNEIGTERGRPCLVAARVDETVEGCDLDGLDVNSWVEQDLMDILILGSGVIDIDVEDFKAMVVAAGTDTLVYPCLYAHPSGNKIITEVAANALATNYWYQGGDGIYTFNFYLHSAPDDLIDVHYDVGDPADLVGKNKLYPADHGVPQTANPHNWWNLALPASMTAPQTVEVPLRVGEDIDGVYTPTLIELRVGFDDDLDGGDTFVIQLNGNTLTQVPGSQEITMTPLASQVLIGDNTVSIQITGGSATVDAVELHVNY